MTDSLIARAIRRYHPEWEPPDNNGWEWVRCLCPFHGDEHPSAAVSYDNNAFNCLACGVKGDAISIIRGEEDVTFAEAVRIAEGLSVGSDQPVQRRSAGKRSGSLPGVSRASSGTHKSVRAGVRGRSTPWA